MKLTISSNDLKELALSACAVIISLVLITAGLVYTLENYQPYAKLTFPPLWQAAYATTSATLNRELMIDAFLNTGVFQANKTIVYQNLDTGLYTVVFIRAGNDNSTQYIPQDTAAMIAQRYGYELEVYDFNQLGELVIVLQQQPLQEQNRQVSVLIGYGSASRGNFAFQPNQVHVNVGDTITWTNNDRVPHTVTSGQNATPDGQFDPGRMVLAATFEHTFTEAGEYPYFYMLHPNMVGTVSVR